jgi:hypothetical protein
VVYGTRFEIGRGVILTEGSNPSLSAITPTQIFWVGVMALKGRAQNPLPQARGLTAEFCETQNFYHSRAAQTAGTERSGVNPSLSAILRFSS